MISAIIGLSFACFILLGISEYWRSKHAAAQYANAKLRAQVDSLRELAKTVKQDVDSKPKPATTRGKAVMEKLDAYMLDYYDQLLSDMLPPLRAPDKPAVREVQITGAVCAAVGCGAKIDFARTHSYKIVGAYKKGSSERVLKFLCTGCTGKRVAA